MSDDAAVVARAAAARLAEAAGMPDLPAAVEARIQAGGSGRPDQYIDPATAIALASLVVSAAGLAWTIHRDLRKETPKPAPEVVARRLRLELEPPPETTDAERDRVITVVVEEVLRAPD